MDEVRLEELRRLARLREQQDEERRTRKIAADLRLQQQERQAQDEAHQAAASPAEEQHYTRLPGPTYTGIR
ncbi:MULTISPECIES: hypothetical protein [unclassified Streptomyces]|jgi:uncharacterized membrane protein YcjF (UPF0283 family)|uniref:hypothetical protein n=1 Tax=unclassified Streptomyces TaxID=2593676 RepID=UPI0033D51F40